MQRGNFPIPYTQDFLDTIIGFECSTVIYLNIGYYDMMLYTDNWKLCMIVILWVKYQYRILPIGFYIAPCVFQNKTSKLFHYMVHVYVCMESQDPPFNLTH